MIIDAVVQLIELLLESGMPSPDSLENQRRARLAVSIVALVGTSTFCLLVGASALRGWSLLMFVGMVLAACWVLAFSVVDFAKELPSLAWLSVAAGIVAAASIVVAGLSALGLLTTIG